MMPASVRLTSVVGAGAWQHPLRGALCSPQQRRLGVVSLAHWSPSCTLVGAIRCVSSSSASSLHVKSRFPQQRRVRGKRITLGAAAVTLVGLGLAASTIYAASADERRPLAEATWPELLRRYFVYSCCSSSTLVDWSPVMIDWCRSTRIPGVRPVFEWCMTHTFFAQFVGGQTVEECMQTVKRASQLSIGSVLNYSAEAEEEQAKRVTARGGGDDGNPKDDGTGQHIHLDKIEEMLHSIRVAGQISEMQKALAVRPRRDDSILVAIKLSGLLRDPSVLERASACIMPREEWVSPPSTMPPLDTIAVGACPGLMIPTSALSDSDVAALKALWHATQSLAECARDNGRVRLLLDAEYSWFQPAIDAVFESCAQQFNKLPMSRSGLGWSWFRQKGTSDDQLYLPLIYNTYQAYLRRTPAYLSMSLERARRGGYSLGVKLVRGAYVEIENALWNTTVVQTPPAMPENDTAVALSLDSSPLDPERHVTPQWKSPVWPSKRLTDECYDACVARLMDEIKADMSRHGARSSARIAVVFAGHNWDSSLAVVEHMLRLGLAQSSITLAAPLRLPPSVVMSSSGAVAVPYCGLQLADGVRGRIHLGQLHGMADDLTHTVRVAFDTRSGGDGPHVVLKYIPYGNLSLTMPYLTRRANENKSVMGAGRSTRERTLVVTEIGHRLREWIPGTSSSPDDLPSKC